MIRATRRPEGTQKTRQRYISKTDPERRRKGPADVPAAAKVNEPFALLPSTHRTWLSGGLAVRDRSSGKQGSPCDVRPSPDE